MLIVAAIFFIFIFAMVWLGIIAGLTFSMPLLTNFFPGQELMTAIAMINVLFTIGLPLLAVILLIVRVVFGRRMGKGWSTAMIVFWFINGRTDNNQVTSHQSGAALVSGFSPSIFKSVLSADFEKYTPNAAVDNR